MCLQLVILKSDECASCTCPKGMNHHRNQWVKRAVELQLTYFPLSVGSTDQVNLGHVKPTLDLS
jgi:hypothetical protein